ncbi:MAG: aminotransferase class IV family protein [Acidimicrobiia bacterium]|nr:aminotransferase class IV family protein [Acidimicrobiia bacterium]
MAAAVVWLDGVLVPPQEASLSVFDHGITVGDGVFETLKVTNGVPFALRRHLARLARSAAGLGLVVPFSEAELRAAAAEVVAASRETRARLRITLTGGVAPLGSDRGDAAPSVIMALAPLPETPPVTDVVTVQWTRNERSAVAGLKTTSYAENVVALAAAHRAGASEALLCNTTGQLCEGTGSNVFVVHRGEILTPTLGSGCLAGITRELVLEWVPEAREADLDPAVLVAADEVFLTSSTRDVQAVARVNADPVGDGRHEAPGPVTRHVAEVFAQRSTDVDP